MPRGNPYRPAFEREKSRWEAAQRLYGISREFPDLIDTFFRLWQESQGEGDEPARSDEGDGGGCGAADGPDTPGE